MNPDALKVDGESAGCLCAIKWPPLPDVSERTLYLLWPLLGRPGAFLAALPVALQVEVASLSTAEPPSLGRGIGACCGRGRHWGGHSRWLRHAGHGGPGDRIGPGGGFRAECCGAAIRRRALFTRPPRRNRMVLERFRPSGLPSPSGSPRPSLQGEPVGFCASWPGGAGQAGIGAADSSPRPHSSLARLTSKTSLS